MGKEQKAGNPHTAYQKLVWGKCRKQEIPIPPIRNGYGETAKNRKSHILSLNKFGGNDMYGLKQLLEQEEYYLKNISNRLEKIPITDDPKKLELSMKGENANYRYSLNGQRVYIKKSNHQIAKELAQNGYYEKLTKLVSRRQRQIAGILKDYRDDEIERLYDNLHPARQRLITPIDPTWRQQVEAWKEMSYEGKSFRDGTMEIYTERGERVRSKSEKILADAFYYAGIDYHYEEPLYLKGYGLVYPDFTFMSEKLHKKMFWEHEGRMDDATYASSAAKKLNLYMKNGYFPGEQLILTYETSDSGLQMDIVKEFIRKYLKDE